MSMTDFWAEKGVFCGPFASSRAFVETIALTNCVAYFRGLETKSDALGRQRGLLLFNAVVSLDSAIDYLWHDRGNPGTVGSFLDDLAREEPALKALRELSNALKHCIRGRQDGPQFVVNKTKQHASEVAPANLAVEVAMSEGEPNITLTISSAVMADAHETVQKAFRFWQARVQEP